jgi:hypothetical protein
MFTKQQEAIEFSRKLKKAGVRMGSYRVYWVAYPAEHGEGMPCVEYYRTNKRATERAVELSTIPSSPLARQAWRVSRGMPPEEIE